MKKSTVTVQYLFTTVKAMEKNLKVLESGLKELRNGVNAWEEDIEKDERISVKLLYGNLVELRKEMVAFLEREYVVAPVKGWAPVEYKPGGTRGVNEIWTNKDAEVLEL